MDRRKFVVATGVGVGLAGCIDANVDSSGGGTDQSDPGDSNGPTGSGDSSDDSDPSLDDEASADESRGDDGNGDRDGDETDNEDETEDGPDRSVTFHSCTRATVSGTFDADDVAFASTGFYDEGLYGDTILEDGVVFGDDVTAPFSGSVTFEIGDESNVDAGDEEIVVEVPDYGNDGTVITSLTTRRADYMGAAPTHANPHADECLGELEPDGDDGTATFDVAGVETNAPVTAGEYLEASVEIENAGGTSGTGTVELIVGTDPERVDARQITLDAGERTILTVGYETPPVDNDQEFPVRVETEGDAVTRTVLVYGTG